MFGLRGRSFYRQSASESGVCGQQDSRVSAVQVHAGEMQVGFLGNNPGAVLTLDRWPANEDLLCRWR